MDFSFRETERYSELVKMTDEALAGAIIDPQFKQTVYDSVYAFEVAVAEPNNLGMNHVFDNLRHLNRIEEVNEKGTQNGGLFLSYGGNKSESAEENLGLAFTESGEAKRIAVIQVNSNFYNEEGHTSTLFHELVHLYSMNYKESRCGLPGRGTDEIVTENLAIRMQAVLDIYTLDYSTHTLAAPNSVNLSETNIRLSNSGYPTTYPLVGCIYDIYGEDKIIQAKFEGGTLPDSLVAIDVAMQNLSGREDAYNFQNLMNAMSDAIKLEYLSDNDFVKYLENIRELRDSSPEIFINGQQYNMADIALVGFESRYVISQMKTYSSLTEEVKPMQRTREVNDILQVLSIAKQIEEPVTFLDIMNAKVTHGQDVDGNRKVQIVLNGNSYIADEFNSTGNIIPSVNYYMGGSLDKKDSIIDMFRNVNAQWKHTDFVMLSEISELTNGQLLSNNKSMTTKDAMIFGAVTGGLTNEVLSSKIKDVKIEEIHDQYGHNLLHAAAANKNSAEFISAVISQKPVEAAKMLKEEDAYGHTPVDYIFKSRNIDALREVIGHISLTDAHIDMLSERRSFMDYSVNILSDIAHKDASLAAKLVNLGARADVACDRGTLLQQAVNLQSMELIDAIGKQSIDVVHKGDTALSMALDIEDSSKRRDIVFKLLENGANPNVCGNGMSPLGMAITSYMKTENEVDSQNSMIAIRELLEHGANPNQEFTIKMDEQEITILPVQILCYGDLDSHTEKAMYVIKELSSAGMNPELRTADCESLKELLESEKGASLSAAMKDSGTYDTVFESDKDNDSSKGAEKDASNENVEDMVEDDALVLSIMND